MTYMLSNNDESSQTICLKVLTNISKDLWGSNYVIVMTDIVKDLCLWGSTYVMIYD